jgi:hypothetical protein
LFLLVKKLQIGHIILLDCFTFLKVKKYNLFTFLTLTVYSRLLLDKNCLLDIHQFLAGQKVPKKPHKEILRGRQHLQDHLHVPHQAHPELRSLHRAAHQVFKGV